MQTTTPTENAPVGRALRIWHVDGGLDPSAVDGVTQGLWALATEQAAMGHEVTLWCRVDPTAEAEELARARGLTLGRFHRSPRSRNTEIIGRLADPPDLVHLHGSWIPAHALLARRLRKRSIPYAVTAHGGHTRHLFGRRSVLRRAYLRLIEQPMVTAAGAVTYYHRSEADEAVRVMGRLPTARLAWFGPDLRKVSRPWDPAADRPFVLYLGRYDVFQKGLDDLVVLAGSAPDVRFELHGTRPASARAAAEFDELAASAPPNLRFGPPIYDDDKFETLVSAALYVQYSRFEGFPLSISEALAHGVPVACRAQLGCTAELAADDACISLDDDPAVAARQLVEALGQPDRLALVAENGRRWFSENQDPATWASDYVSIYRDVLTAVTTT